MGRSWLHSVGESVLLALAGPFSLGSPLPRTVMTGSLQACITESAGTAWLGIHLRVLSLSPDCPHGTYAPGPNFTEAGYFSIAISGSAFIAGVLLALWALGLGLWARRTMRAARVWVNRRLGLMARPPVVPIDVSLRVPLEALIADLRGAVLAHQRHRRGPPVLVPA